jgi:UDP-glucuronate 4-epimerase
MTRKVEANLDFLFTGSNLPGTCRTITLRLMEILVTGGAGFIGSHLVEALLAAGHGVSVIDDFNDFYSPKLKRANLAAVAHRIEIHAVDLCRADAVARVVGRGRFDLIVHLAARAGVGPSIHEPRLYVDTNINGTLNLLEAARAGNVPRFIFASSSSVYGLCPNVPFREDAPLTGAISPYAATKIAGEQLCASYAHLHGIRTVCLRFFNVYGPRLRPDLAIHLFTSRILRGEPIDQFGDGSMRRDYTYIDDTIQGVLGALTYDGPMFDIINLGESETTTLSTLIRLLETSLERKARIRLLPERPGDVPLTCADISKARDLLHYRPSTPIGEGIPRFVNWFVANQAGAPTANARPASATELMPAG